MDFNTDHVVPFGLQYGPCMFRLYGNLSSTIWTMVQYGRLVRIALPYGPNVHMVVHMVSTIGRMGDYMDDNMDVLVQLLHTA